MLIRIAFLLVSMVWAVNASAHILVNDAYVRGLPPGQPNTAVFMTLHNDTSDDMELVGATTSAANAVEIHEHKHDNGMMRMRQVMFVPLPAGQQFEFRPGGHHIMLLGLTKPLRHGDSIELTLQFASGATSTHQVRVQSVLQEKR